LFGLRPIRPTGTIDAPTASSFAAAVPADAPAAPYCHTPTAASPFGLLTATCCVAPCAPTLTTTAPRGHERRELPAAAA
jgi:hypothetical protein